MNPRNYQDNLLNRISNGITGHAVQLQQLDLARLSRGIDSASQFQTVLANLKHQIARKVELRAGVALVTGSLELQTRAA
jgi:hypothetical protein